MSLAKLGKGALFSAEQAIVGRDEIRAPLKTLAWEHTSLGLNTSALYEFLWLHRGCICDVRGYQCTVTCECYLQPSICTVRFNEFPVPKFPAI